MRSLTNLVWYYLKCRWFGHGEHVEMPLYKAWDGSREVGSLHCADCGKMIGEYRRKGAL